MNEKEKKKFYNTREERERDIRKSAAAGGLLAATGGGLYLLNRNRAKKVGEEEAKELLKHQKTLGLATAIGLGTMGLAAYAHYKNRKPNDSKEKN